MRQYGFRMLALVFPLLLLPGRLLISQTMPPPEVDASGRPFSYPVAATDILGVMDAESAAMVTQLGTFQMDSGELLFFAGDQRVPLTQRVRTTYDGYLPIVKFSAEWDGIIYAISAFLATLDGRLDSPLVTFVRVDICNAARESKQAVFASAVRFSDAGDSRARAIRRQTAFDRTWDYEMRSDHAVRGGKLVYMFEERPALERLLAFDQPGTVVGSGKDIQVLETTPVLVASYRFVMAPGAVQTLTFKMPYEAVSLRAKTFVSDLRAARLEDHMERTVQFWKDLLGRGAEFQIPEPKVSDALKASLIYCFLTRSKVAGDYIQNVNRFSGPWPSWHPDVPMIVRTYDLFGFHDAAEQILRSYKRLVRALAPVNKRGLPYAGFGQTLWALVEHVKLTRQVSSAQEFFPLVEDAMEWFARVRSSDPLGIFPCYEAGDSAGSKPLYLTADNFWTLLGVKQSVFLAGFVGSNWQADEYMREYEKFHAAFMGELRQATSKANGFIPERLHAEGVPSWSHVMGVYPFEVLSAQDPAVSATLFKARESLPEKEPAAPGGSQRGTLDELSRAFVAQTHLVRGEQELVLRDLYELLLHTSSTHAGGATTNVISRECGAPDARFAASYATLIRNMLVREQGNDLHLLSCVSPAWLEPGKTLGFENAPTYFGPISLKVRAGSGQADIKLTTKWGAPPAHIIVHVPYFARVLEAVRDDGKPCLVEEGQIALPPTTERLKITWELDQLPDMNYEALVKAYRQAYPSRYESYLALGGQPWAANSIELISREERDRP